jgi:hypothetical protein
MKIAYALLANSAEFSADGKLYMLGGDIDTLYAPSLPVTQPALTLALKLLAPSVECDVEHRLRVDLAGPEGGLIEPGMDLTFIPRAKLGDESRDVGVGFALVFQRLVFTQFGEHTFRVMIDGQEARSLPLSIAQKALPAPNLDVRPTASDAASEQDATR